MAKKVASPKSWKEIEEALNEVPEGEWIVVEKANAEFTYPSDYKPKRKAKIRAV